MKNKIQKNDFLIVGAGLIGAIAALALIQKKYKVLVIDKDNKINKDNRTLAVNANSIDFLKNLGIWKLLKSQPQPINKIIIKDNINVNPLIFENEDEIMGNVILNKEIYEIARKKLEKLNILKIANSLATSEIFPKKKVIINNKYYTFKKIIISIGKNVLSDTSNLQLLSTLAMLAPFNKIDKQAILESPNISTRIETINSILDLNTFQVVSNKNSNQLN